MSTPATLFVVYIGIGLLLMVFAVASRGKEKRTKGFEIHTFNPVDGIDAGLLIFTALLWPVWLLAILVKKKPTE